MHSTSRSGGVKSSPRHSQRGCLRFCRRHRSRRRQRGAGARVGWRSGRGRLGSQDGGSAARARLDRVGACTCPVLSAEGGAGRPLRLVVLDVVREHQRAIRAFLVSPPQTNEVGRSGVLVGGFLEIAKKTGLPLRLSRNRRERRPQHHLGSLSLSSRRGRLGRPAEPRQPRAKLGRPVAADRRPTPCDRASCLRHRANRSRRPRPAPPYQSLHLGGSARAPVPSRKRHRPRTRPRSKS